MDKCELCPRRCGVDRSVQKGFCGGEAFPFVKIARAALHFGEEPCISGRNGSGTVFFSGCVLKCPFCQNYPISTGGYGKEVDLKRLSEIFLELREQGAHNINLVSPTQYSTQIISALELVKDRLDIPVVYNTGGYELPEIIGRLDGLVDIYLTDLKYFSAELSHRYSAAGDYFENAAEALEKMAAQTGTPRFDSDGMMKKGVIVRHLILPNAYHDSEKIIDYLAEKYPNDEIVLSLMSQYTPCYDTDKYKEINRRLTTFEYRKIVDRAFDHGLHGYMQERSAATLEMTPKWDLTGI